MCGTSVVLSEAVTPQQVDAVRRSHVQVDVLQVEQDGEQQRPLQVLRLWDNTNRTKPDERKDVIKIKHHSFRAEWQLTISLIID